MSGYAAPTMADACSYLVRYLVRSAFSMAAGSVRPANQSYPTGGETDPFATVQIIGGPTGGFGASSIKYIDDPTTASTKVVEDIQTLYHFKAKIQFFRHAGTADGAGVAPFGLGALDKASRLETVLGSTTMMMLMERMGLGLESGDQPIDVSALLDSARWEDRASVTLTFVIVNQEQFMLESFGSANITVEVQEPGDGQTTNAIIEVTQ